MKKRGGALFGLFADGVSAGLDYEAYKNSNSFMGMIGMRLYYGLLIIGIPILVIGAIWLLFGKVTTKKEKFEDKPMFRPSV